MALSIIFDIHRAVAGSLYFYDLIGAALGAVLVTVLLHVLGGEAALLAACAAPAVAAALIAGQREAEVRDQRSEVSKDTPLLTRGLLPRAIRVAAIFGVV